MKCYFAKDKNELLEVGASRKTYYKSIYLESNIMPAMVSLIGVFFY